jgi:hypothetical protein
VTSVLEDPNIFVFDLADDDFSEPFLRGSIALLLDITDCENASFGRNTTAKKTKINE